MGNSIHSLVLRKASVSVDEDFEKQLKLLHTSLCSWSSILRRIFQPWKLYNDLKVGLLYIGMVWSYTDFKIMHYYNDLFLAMLVKILSFSAQWPHIPLPQYAEVLIIPLVLFSFNWQAFIWIFPMQPLLCGKSLYKFSVF